MPLVTRADMGRFAPHARPSIVAAIVDHADAVLPRWGLATAPRLQMLMAQMAAESGGFTALEENLDYTAKRLMQVWPRRFPTLAAAAAYAHAPRRLANAVYGGRMGNRAGTDDGWLNRGQGLLEETGADNLARLAHRLGMTPEAARTWLTSDAGMLDAACAIFVMLGGPRHADAGDVLGCTRAINGGTNGLEARRRAFALARTVWPRLAAAQPRPPDAPRRPAPRVPVIPPETKVLPVKHFGFLALLAGLFGASAAQAGAIDVTPLATASVDNICLPVLTVCIPTVSAVLVRPLARFLGQSAANKFQAQFDQEAKVALAWAARQADAWIMREDFHINIDSWLVDWAANYMMGHALPVTRKAGGILAQKLEARLDAHDDILGLKARAANLNPAPARAPVAAAA